MRSDGPDHDTDPLAETQAPTSAPETAKKKRPVRAGDVLGRYELVDDIGEGGMATVYRAKDRELRREVAIKVLFPHLSRRPEIVHRFQREARAAAGLEHPNILRIYDVGDAGDDDDTPPFIVMELVRGRTLLGEIEQRGPMFAEVAACVGALLADALAAAHQAGIIHRDIKPANVLIAQDGRVLLADFGVARLETEDSLVTKTGALLGTPAYMSPEQASGDTATAKSDLYSLGATLYQLVTGTLPYTGSAAKVMAQIAAGALVSAVKKRAEVGPDLSRVIDRLMATDAAARPSSAKDVAAELRAIAATGGLAEPTDELKAYFADPSAFVQAKTPAVVSSTITAANRAVAESKLPRAMALADRASALAPDDPAVAALVHTVTEGGRASHRRRVVATIGACVIIAGSAALAGVKLLGGDHAATPDAAMVVMVTPSDAPIVPVVAADASVAVPPGLVDASPRRDAATTHVHESIIPDAVQANAPAPADAAPLIVPPDAAAARGAILVTNDTWCDVTIDHVDYHRRKDQPYPVEAGHHVVTCAQTGTGREWTREVDVAAGQTVTASGTLLGAVAVTFEVDGKLDGAAYTRGQRAQVKTGRHLLEAGGKKYIDVRSPCVVRDQPDLDCYPLVP